MFKITFVVGMFLLMSPAKAFTVSECMDILEPMSENCEEKPTKDEIKEVIMNKKDCSRGAKCFRWCLMKELEVAQDNSTQMDASKTVELMSMGIDVNEAVLRKMVDSCNTKNAAIQDGCEAAHAHSICIMDECKNNGIEIPEMEDK